MRIMLMEWANSLPELTEVASRLKKNNHQILYWVRDNSYFKVDEAEFPNTIFHEHVSAREGKSAEGLNLSDFEPLGSDVVSNFFDAESVVLSMMERYYGEKTLQEKKQLFYDLLRYWYGVAVKLKPEVVIFEEMPHHLHSYVAYSVFKFLKIKTIIVNSIYIKDKLLITSDIKFNSLELQSVLRKNFDKDFDFDNLSSDVKANLESGTPVERKPVKIIDFYNERKLKNKYGEGFSFSKILYKIKFFVRLFRWKNLQRYILNRLIGNAKKEYVDMQINPDFGSKYVYVPLHFQPEASTTIFGGIFANQINFIEILSAALPRGWKIYIKDHPVQFYNNGIGYNAFRYKGYYQRISKIKGVEIVPLDTDTYKLLELSQVTATVTGTAAWEAALRLKPALIFGDIWFQDCPSIFKVNSVESCREAFCRINSHDFKIKKQELVNYLSSLEQVTINAILYFFAKPEFFADEATNVNNIYNAIVKSMEQS
ncbi:capsular biosynthesis protein [Patescibacteria group bacterium]|nr:capsular biosynthesis protein [Patescibacteria group bacterium]